MAKQSMTYAASGVDIDAGDKMVSMIRRHMTRTYGPRVIEQHGGFAGLFRLDYNEKLFARNYKDPVLVACTDGVGTKVKLAAEMGLYDTVGIDLVAMSVNDLIVGGAEPLFFLDYLAVNDLDPQQATDMVKGVSDGCVQAGCALLGGETAEMPDVYSKGEFDMAGFAVGVVEKGKVIDGSRVERGDIILGLSSSGIHSNGYSLVRAVVTKKKLKLDKVYDELEEDRPLGRVLLEPTRIYAKPILSVLNRYVRKRVVTAMAHITGGGLVGNLNRVLPKGADAKIERKAWTIPPVFRFLAKHGNIEQQEIDRVFNQGVGYCVVVKPAFAASVMGQLEDAGETVYWLGSIVKGTGKVKIV
ncbi:phosphoribosylformylglycinamidine cyclo-ligase [Planctomycetales bacterium ZRK34]|nr:phosphoribosylformylglycinamidine cyclo-ligase [Planctomycetales bacterium ZRK34]